MNTDRKLEEPYRVVEVIREILTASPRLGDDLEGLITVLCSRAKEDEFTRSGVLMGIGLEFAGGKYTPAQIRDAMQKAWPRSKG